MFSRTFAIQIVLVACLVGECLTRNYALVDLTEPWNLTPGSHMPTR